jgi:hypothetical protein
VNIEIPSGPSSLSLIPSLLSLSLSPSVSIMTKAKKARS